jgi:hypothetical protein
MLDLSMARMIVMASPHTTICFDACGGVCEEVRTEPTTTQFVHGGAETCKMSIRAC